eukprot:1154512-Pelagomonas_calceolata.AAC.1
MNAGKTKAVTKSDQECSHETCNSDVFDSIPCSTKCKLKSSQVDWIEGDECPERSINSALLAPSGTCKASRELGYLVSIQVATEEGQPIKIIDLQQFCLFAFHAHSTSLTVSGIIMWGSRSFSAGCKKADDNRGKQALPAYLSQINY